MRMLPVAGVLLLTLLIAPPAAAVEIQGMGDFVGLHGRYGPNGNCNAFPRFEVTAAGINFETAAGQVERVTTLEYAASYGGHDYNGPLQWFFPFGRDGNYPVLMTFNSEDAGRPVSIEPHDEGFRGGPPLTPRNAALVNGSPYKRCP